jgi:thiamine kinase-like enzyme
MIMEFISGRTVKVTDFEDSAHLAAFAKFLKRLHLSEVEFPHAVSPFKRFRDFCVKMDIAPSRFLEMQALMADLEALFQLFPNRPVPSHLDLHPLNIMVDKDRFCLVDWVNGGMYDPWFDLATFSVFQELNKEKAQQFLTEYLERAPMEFEWNRFIVTQPIRPLVIAAALFSAHNNHLAESMFQTALALIDQDTFHEALNAIKRYSRS